MKKLYKVLAIVGLLALSGQVAAIADPIVFKDSRNRVVAEPSGDDSSFRMEGVTAIFNGTLYESVYISTNNIISFGRSSTSCCGIPNNDKNLVAMNYMDWTVDDHAGRQPDEYLIADLSGDVLTITISSVPYYDGDLSPTLTILTVYGVGGSSEVSFSYTVDGVTGPDFIAWEDENIPSTFMQLIDGEPIPLNFAIRSVATGNLLKLTAAPTLTQSGSSLKCAPGSYTYLNSGVAEQASLLDSLVYTLMIDGKVVSRIAAGNTSVIPADLLGSLTQGVKATADMNGATFDAAGLSDYNASCQVYAWQANANMQAMSSSIADTAKIAKAVALEQTIEAQRAIATAANFTAEARAARKRAADR